MKEQEYRGKGKLLHALMEHMQEGRLVQAFRHLDMRRKLIYTYALPVLLVSTIVLIAGYLSQEKRFEARLRSDMEQAMVQADSFLTSYLQGMDHVTQMIVSNKDLNSLMQDPEFAEHESIRETFSEHYQLVDIFSSIELLNGEYRVGIYMDDSLLYSNNMYYIYPSSLLKENADYPAMERSFTYGVGIYEILQDKRTSEAKSIQDYLAQLTPMNVVKEDGRETVYVIKTEVPVSFVRQLLRNAALTRGTIMYLEDSGERRLVTSDEQGEALLDSIQFTTPYGASDWSRVKLMDKEYYVLHRRSGWRGWRLTALIPVSEYKAQTSFLFIWLLCMLGAIFAVVSMSSSVVAAYYAGKIDALNNRMLHLDQGTGAARGELMEPTDDAMDTLYRNFDFMLDQVDQLMKEQYRLGRSISNAEMRALQAQINPHFLYNTLDLINWGAMDYGADNVAAIARNLGQFYRLSLNHGRSVISINDELRHVEAFVSIENAHYEGAVHLDIQVPDEIRSLACLNITLQPFVENSIVHGIAEFPDLKECNIWITAVREEDDILFDIIDDGHGISPATAAQVVEQKAGAGSCGYGISNVNFRIRLCYGEKYGVQYIFDQDKGTHVRVRIKALHAEELEKLLS